MARPRIDTPPPAAIRALADDEGRLGLHVTPGARAESIAITDGHLAIKVRAKPEDGKANDAVIALLAQALGIGASHITLLRGATGRDKLVRINPAA